jgi:hypothetical protein
MKNQLAIAGALMLGFLVGSFGPGALAHDESECTPCVCPECPSIDSDGDGIPDTLDAQHDPVVQQEDRAAIDKALKAIEEAEKKEQEMQQQMQQQLPLDQDWEE